MRITIGFVEVILKLLPVSDICPENHKEQIKLAAIAYKSNSSRFEVIHRKMWKDAQTQLLPFEMKQQEDALKEVEFGKLSLNDPKVPESSQAETNGSSSITSVQHANTAATVLKINATLLMNPEKIQATRDAALLRSESSTSTYTANAHPGNEGSNSRPANLN
ncbi:hypothetical protein NHQ30_003832 [Ciborinia camelliae]|nr:hypothetical protein NHQ30_003832 [Ciborinia camelliae]